MKAHGRCEWCFNGYYSGAGSKERCHGADDYLPVCQKCYYRKVRGPDADTRFRLWGMAYIRAKRAGDNFDLWVAHVADTETCEQSKTKLYHGYVSFGQVPPENHATLVMINGVLGYVKGNVRVVARKVAGLVNDDAGAAVARMAVLLEEVRRLTPAVLGLPPVPAPANGFPEGTGHFRAAFAEILGLDIPPPPKKPRRLPKP